MHQDKQIVLFSNLFWKWKYPFYNSVFAYHWFMFELQHVVNITQDQVEQQRHYWQEAIYSLPEIQGPADARLQKAAFLDRAVAGLLVDGFLMDPQTPISEYIFDANRKQVIDLTDQLQ